MWIHTGSNCPIPNAWTTWPSIQICGKTFCMCIIAKFWVSRPLRHWQTCMISYIVPLLWQQSLKPNMPKAIKAARTTSGGSRISPIPGGVKLFNAPKSAKNKELSTFLLIGDLLLVLPWIRQWIDETLDWSASDWLVKPRSCNLIYANSQHSYYVCRLCEMFLLCK